ncbi:MAG: FAD-binding protein [Methanomassiliicoccales archaeon]|jgi:thioredoxin reductase (NADPH)
MIYDLIIIGAGPGGLTAGVFARSRKLSTLILVRVFRVGSS